MKSEKYSVSLSGWKIRRKGTMLPGGHVCLITSYHAHRKSVECVQLKKTWQLPSNAQNKNGFRHLAGFADRYLSIAFLEDKLPDLPTSHFSCQNHLSEAAWVSNLFMIIRANDSTDESSLLCWVSTEGRKFLYLWWQAPALSHTDPWPLLSQLLTSGCFCLKYNPRTPLVWVPKSYPLGW